MLDNDWIVSKFKYIQNITVLFDVDLLNITEWNMKTKSEDRVWSHYLFCHLDLFGFTKKTETHWVAWFELWLIKSTEYSGIAI
jgi:hypothetical protein